MAKGARAAAGPRNFRALFDVGVRRLSGSSEGHNVSN